MRYYKVVNLNRPHMGFQVIPESGWNEVQKNPALSKVMQSLGECDASGALLGSIKENNFISTVVNKSEVFKGATDPEQLSESLNTKEDGRKPEKAGKQKTGKGTTK